MEITKKQRYIAGFVIALIILVFDIIYYLRTPFFVPLIVIAVTVAWVQYWADFFIENKRQKNIEARFPDFVRNLVGAVKSGMPITKAIVHVADDDYGALTPYVQKLAKQIEWSIPVHKAFKTFSDETGNPIIQRAISTVIEAEESGGNIEDVLDSITDSLVEIKKIKAKRKASVHSQIVQNYIIFFVFLGVIIVIQNLLLPYVANLQGTAITGDMAAAPTITQKVTIDFSSLYGFMTTFPQWFVSMNGVFLMLVVIQGGFAGLVIGKLSEGQIKFGIKHSLILMTVSFFVISLAQGLG